MTQPTTTLNQNIKWLLICLLAIALFPGITVCAADTGTEADWQRKVLEQRSEKDHEFKTSPTSPMAGVKRFTLKSEKGFNTFFTEVNGNITLTVEKKEGSRFRISFDNGKWKWEPCAMGVLCTIGKKTLQPGLLLQGQNLIKTDRCTVMAIPGAERLVLIAFDPQRPMIKHFEHLHYFPPDRKYAVNAQLERFPKCEKFTVLTSRNEEKTYYKYASIRFELDGKPLKLTAFKFSLDSNNPDSRYLFIPFSDATSGAETYEVGRFLDIIEPEGKSVVLDFNQCYNPLCNYAEVYNCPVPPLENHLKIAIKAGEKVYPH